jgi:hypothetical protein
LKYGNETEKALVEKVLELAGATAWKEGMKGTADLELVSVPGGT